MSSIDLLKSEIQQQIDLALEAIPNDFRGFPSTNIRSRWDFIYGYEYGRIIWSTFWLYVYKIIRREPTKDEIKEIHDQIKSIMQDRLQEIRQAISKEEAKSTGSS